MVRGSSTCESQDPVTEAILGYMEKANIRYLKKLGRKLTPAEFNNFDCYTIAIMSAHGIEGATVVSMAEELYPGVDPDELLRYEKGPLSGELHYLVKYKGKFYDAEIPRGVDSIYEVPMVKRSFCTANRKSNEIEARPTEDFIQKAFLKAFKKIDEGAKAVDNKASIVTKPRFNTAGSCIGSGKIRINAVEENVIGVLNDIYEKHDEYHMNVTVTVDPDDRRQLIIWLDPMDY